MAGEDESQADNLVVRLLREMREETRDGFAELRAEMHDGFASLEARLGRVEATIRVLTHDLKIASRITQLEVEVEKLKQQRAG